MPQQNYDVIKNNTHLSIPERLEYLKQNGSNSLAYHTLQKDLKFFHIPGKGYIAFKLITGKVMVLSDPIFIKSNDNCKNLLKQFIEKYPKAIFWQISENTANLLSQITNFYINEVGIETFIDLPEFSLKGRKKEDLRRLLNVAKRNNIEVKEFKEDNIFIKHREDISNDWLMGKLVKGQEMSFLARPSELQTNVGIRRFYAIQNERVIAYVVFDPMYRNNFLKGYASVVVRGYRNNPRGTNDLIHVEAINKFKEEGLAVVSLGLSPYYRVEDNGAFRYSNLTKKYLNYSYERANYIFNFKNLAYHKSRYRGREEKVYIATNKYFPILELINVYKTCGIDPIKQLCSYLKLRITGKKLNIVKY